MTSVAAQTCGTSAKPIAVAEVAAVVGALAAGAALVTVAPDPWVATPLVAVATGAIVAWITWRDLRTFTIPDGAVLALAILAVCARWVEAQGGDPATLLVSLAIDAALPGGALLLFREIHFRRRGADGLGLGDVKLAAAGGLLVGTLDFSWALFAAAVSGLALVAARALLARALPDMSDRLAFGALLAPALWALWSMRHMPFLVPLAGF